MKFLPILQPATFLRRYKRFLTDVCLPDGKEITVHCPNTGSMKNCLVEQSPCWISDSQNDKRKYRYTWELASTPCGNLASVNTGRANKLVLEAIAQGIVQELAGYRTLATEKKYGEQNSRIDVLLSDHAEDKRTCFVEVKSVTLAEKKRQGFFPDAVSTRGQKHLQELVRVVASGNRGVLFFCAQHTGIDSVSPADEIDPKYGELLRQAVNAGVEVIAYNARITEQEIYLAKKIPVLL